MPVRLHHIVAGAHDLPGPARFWTQAPGWMILSEREAVIGTEEVAPAGRCFMPVTDPKTVKNRVHLDLTSSAQVSRPVDYSSSTGYRPMRSLHPTRTPRPCLLGH